MKRKKKNCCKLMVAELISWALVVQIGKITFRFFFFSFPALFLLEGKILNGKQERKKKKDRGRRPYYLLTYNSTSNDSDSFKKQQKVC